MKLLHMDWRVEKTYILICSVNIVWYLPKDNIYILLDSLQGIKKGSIFVICEDRKLVCIVISLSPLYLRKPKLFLFFFEKKETKTRSYNLGKI